MGQPTRQARSVGARQVVAFAIATLVTILTLMAVIAVDRIESGRHRDALRSATYSQLVAIRERLDRALAGPMQSTRGMAAQIVAHGDVGPDEFDRIAAVLLAGHRNIRNMTLSHGTVIARCYPLAGNESVIGVDYHDRPAQWSMVELAIQSRAPVMSGPVDLIQGGHGLIGRAAVFLPPASGSEPRLFGLVNVVIDFEGVLADAGLSNPELPIQVAIRGRDGKGAEGGMVWGDEAVFSGDPVESDLILPFGKWRLAAVPRQGWNAVDSERDLVRVLGLGLWLCVAAATFGGARYLRDRWRAERALIDSESRFKDFAHATSDWFFELDADLRFSYFSPTTEKVIGVDPSPWLGRRHDDLPVLDPNAPEWRRHLQDLGERKPLHNVEFTLTAPRGMVRSLRLSALPVFDEDSAFCGYRGAGSDITAERIHQAEIDRLQSRLRNILCYAGEGICGLDKDGHVIFANAAAERLTGWGENELLGMQFAELVHPPAEAEALQAVLRRPGQHRGDGVRLRSHGERDIPIEFVIDTLVEEEQVAGAVVVFKDISARLASEAELRRLSMAIEQSPVTVVITDPTGTIQYVNPAFSRVTGYSADEAIGANPRLLKSGLEPPETYEAMWRAILRGQGWEGELRNRRKDGSLFWEKAWITPVLDADGAIVNFVGVKEDITRRREIEEELRQTSAELARSNVELEQFAAIASHDLREPLRMITSYLQLLKRRYGGQLDSQADEFIAFAVDGAGRMERLILGLLAYSRVGTRGNPFQPIEMEQVLTDATDNLRPMIDQSGARVSHDPLPRVDGDAIQLVSLMQNLIANAIKYRRPEVPPEIHVGATRGNGFWTFALRDNGIGISPEFHDRVFVIFQRLQTRQECDGSGIGLAVCKRIVERHRGRIWVESAEGQGSTFFFTLPAEG